jgi:hypothetical protein
MSAGGARLSLVGRLEEVEMVGTLEAELALDASDRCDRCGAQAVARATMASGSHLLFCGHHLRAHEAGLQAASARIARASESARHPRGHAE